MRVDRKLIATVLAYAAVYFASVVLLRVLPPGTEYTIAVVFLLSSLPPWSLFLTWPWRSRRAGPVRLELGRPGGSHAFRLMLVLLVLVPFPMVGALYFLKAYVAALYLPADVAAERALADVPKRLEISYLVAIRGEDFDKGAAPVLRRNLSTAELGPLQSRLDRLNTAYRDVQPGDYALSYQHGRGTELSLNGTPLVTIEGADFAAAYFGIWLGREPIDDGLKKALLKGTDVR